MSRIYWSILLLALSCSVVFACDTPDETLGTYLKYDYQGDRLSYEVSTNIDKLEEHSEFEPAWDVITLATAYETKSITIKDSEAVATVSYRNAWEISSNFNRESIKDEIIEVHMKKIEGCWKVVPPFYQPHVNPESAIKHFEKLLKDGRLNNLDKEYLDYTQSELNNIKRYKNAIK